MSSTLPHVVLFGYDSSPFTQKVRLALRLRQIPYTFILVPSMMPRPILLDNFNLTYRKIPVLAIDKDLYIDTSLIIEILASHPAFSKGDKYPPLYPNPRIRALSRVLSSHYTDRPLFRLTTGLIPQTVWQTKFGDDRAGLIGHKLDPAKLGAKIPRNLSSLDTFLSILEPMFTSSLPQKWFLDTDQPSAGDIALFYQLEWGQKISQGDGIEDLTGGGTVDGDGEGVDRVLNERRFPGLMAWLERIREYFATLPPVETRVEREKDDEVAEIMKVLDQSQHMQEVQLMGTAVAPNTDLDERIGLKTGSRVSIAPDDTGRDDPTMGTLIGLSTEEVVIVADLIQVSNSAVRDVRMHFPRIGFVVRPVELEDKDGGQVYLSAAPKAKL